MRRGRLRLGHTDGLVVTPPCELTSRMNPDLFADPGDTTAHSLCSDTGMEVDLASWGAAIVALRVPVPGGLRNVVLSLPSADAYRDNPFYLGATVGRYAGRVGGGRLVINGEEYGLDPNDSGHCLHGGRAGLSTRNWSLAAGATFKRARFELVSPDGDQGFPGELQVSVTYRVQGSALAIDYAAEADRDTAINLCNHAYFCLNDRQQIDDHIVQVHADRCLATDAQRVPTGALDEVRNTRFDLRAPAALSKRLRDQRIDRTYLITARPQPHPLSHDRPVRHAATVTAPDVGLRLDVYGSQPALQLYTGDYLEPPLRPRSGLCLESQRCPDAPNHAQFPPAVLAAGERYRETVIYAFT